LVIIDTLWILQVIPDKIILQQKSGFLITIKILVFLDKKL